MSHLSLLSAIPLSLYGLLADPGMSPEAPIHFKLAPLVKEYGHYFDNTMTPPLAHGVMRGCRAHRGAGGKRLCQLAKTRGSYG